MSTKTLESGNDVVKQDVYGYAIQKALGATIMRQSYIWSQRMSFPRSPSQASWKLLNSFSPIQRFLQNKKPDIEGSYAISEAFGGTIRWQKEIWLVHVVSESLQLGQVLTDYSLSDGTKCAYDSFVCHKPIQIRPNYWNAETIQANFSSVPATLLPPIGKTQATRDSGTESVIVLNTSKYKQEQWN